MRDSQDTWRREARTAVALLVVLGVVLVLASWLRFSPVVAACVTIGVFVGSSLGRRTLKSGYTELPADSTKPSHEPLRDNGL
jgi:energy-coupling factor transporter transmembrane protein EcfT